MNVLANSLNSDKMERNSLNTLTTDLVCANERLLQVYSVCVWVYNRGHTTGSQQPKECSNNVALTSLSVYVCLCVCV